MSSSSTSTPTTRTRVTREPQLGIYDRDVVNRILDEGFICHVGFTIDQQTYVIPTSYGRAGNDLYIHGSAASCMLRGVKDGIPVCVTVTLLDGLVLARSVFNHSMNYRSVVVLGTAIAVEDPEEKVAALHALSEHVIPGRWADSRYPNDQELKATLVLRVPIKEFSAKVRTGPPIDELADYSFKTWAGVIPLEMVARRGIKDPRLSSGVDVPTYVARYSRRKT